MTYNISTFMSWFITQFINIGSNLLGKLDNFIIYGNVSMMDFMITITILGAFISIIITAPKLSIADRATREKKVKNTTYKKKG